MTHTRSGTLHRTMFAAVVALLALLIASGCTRTAAEDPPAAETLRLQTKEGKLKTTGYKSAQLSSHPVLVVVLHGDLLGFRAIPRSTYHYVFADQATKKI